MSLEEPPFWNAIAHAAHDLQDIVRIIGHILCYAISRTAKEVSNMRGYYSSFGYCGLVDGGYKLFATEEDYRDYMMQR